MFHTNSSDMYYINFYPDGWQYYSSWCRFIDLEFVDGFQRRFEFPMDMEFQEFCTFIASRFNLRVSYTKIEDIAFVIRDESGVVGWFG